MFFISKAPTLAEAFNMVGIDQFKMEEVQLRLHRLTKGAVGNMRIEPSNCTADVVLVDFVSMLLILSPRLLKQMFRRNWNIFKVMSV